MVANLRAPLTLGELRIISIASEKHSFSGAPKLVFRDHFGKPMGVQNLQKSFQNRFPKPLCFATFSLHDSGWILSSKCTLPTRVPLERARAKRVFAVFGRRQVWALFWAPFSLHFRTFLEPQTSRKPPRNVFEIQTNFEAYFLTILAPLGGPQGGPKNVKNQQK